MYGKVCYTQSIIIDLTHLISFELRRVIGENACKKLLNLIPAKKIAQRAQRESNTDFKVKVCMCFLPHHQYICVNMIGRSCYKYYTLII